jgi:hypothetical protein
MLSRIYRGGIMPNWCQNNVVIEGDKDALDKLIKDITNDDDKISLTNTMPTPTEFVGIHSGSITIDDVRYSNWYEDEDGTRRPVMDMVLDELKEKYKCDNSNDWQYLNWGTKWGDYETVIDRANDTTLNVWFESAWGEPFMLLQHIAEMYKLKMVNKYLDEFEYYDEVEPHQTDYPIENYEMIVQEHQSSMLEIINKSYT